MTSMFGEQQALLAQELTFIYSAESIEELRAKECEITSFCNLKVARQTFAGQNLHIVVSQVGKENYTLLATWKLTW